MISFLNIYSLSFWNLTCQYQPWGLRVDPASVQAIEHRPKLKPIEVVDDIPVIDLSTVFIDPPDHNTTQQIITRIGATCETCGFFQVVNHGVPSETRKKVAAMAKKFFDGSSERKRKVKRDEVNPIGYYESEHTKNVRDWKEVFDFLVHDPSQISASHEPEDKELKILTNQ